MRIGDLVQDKALQRVGLITDRFGAYITNEPLWKVLWFPHESFPVSGFMDYSDYAVESKLEIISSIEDCSL
jgi:hypothetical protein